MPFAVPIVNPSSGGSGLNASWTKKTISYTDLSVASNTKTITNFFTITAGHILTDIVAYNNTNFFDADENGDVYLAKLGSTANSVDNWYWQIGDSHEGLSTNVSAPNPYFEQLGGSSVSTFLFTFLGGSQGEGEPLPQYSGSMLSPVHPTGDTVTATFINADGSLNHLNSLTQGSVDFYYKLELLPS